MNAWVHAFDYQLVLPAFLTCRCSVVDTCTVLQVQLECDNLEGRNTHGDTASASFLLLEFYNS